MNIVTICTEGESSEPNYIWALKEVSLGTVARRNFNLEVVTIPLGGNQGHKKIFEKADQAIANRKLDNQNILSVIGDDDSLEKWLIVDHDKMERNGITEAEFRQMAADYGYNLVINKPNFEFFVLCHFMSARDADMVLPKDYQSAINENIHKYNAEYGYSSQDKSALRLPDYDKDKHTSRDLFWRILDQNRNLAERLSKSDACMATNGRSEMWKIISRIRDEGR